MKPNNLYDSCYLFLSTIIICTLCILNFGCNNQVKISEEPESTSSEKQLSSPVNQVSDEIFQTEIKATKPWKIAYILKTIPEEPYWKDVKEGAEKAAQNFNIDITIINSEKPQTSEFVEDQIILVANLIKTEEIDGIIIGSSDSIRLVPAVEKAINSGIPVIAMDTPLNSDQILTFVGFDNFSGGKSMGEWVVKNLGGKGTVAILDGAPNHDNAIQRRRGFMAGLKTGDMKVIAIESANWEQSKAQEIATNFFKKFENIDAIIAANDSMALGASQAVENTQYPPIIITGFDGLENGLQAIKQGKITATINQVPKQQARLAIQLMIRHLENGETFPNVILLPNTEVITSENFD
ncbi:MAG: sugar ABC transporter substrate-binding protein [Okeania sp. SIO3B5]|uniref:sugar ABC transporter substrate-binding protein n=1 Tax=Okeania sp. SIO3B5 TaxID=2607811 RepID=UPI0013FFAEAB|nr:sugar ABC transporter substrate-binding protein [Okeania sp. SIO3B5]NEO51968.1 sugar ABC transporter substrate-binding protein [Okeania sp. SIO3B5]